MEQISFTINGMTVSANVKENQTLLELLRLDLNLKGTKEGCGTGECGACTILLNGRPVNSCLVLAVEVNGQEVLTVEGLARDGKLDPIQEAFISTGAVQCGFCTPGLIMVTKYLLQKNPDPTEEEIRRAIVGNLCRCTGYKKIVKAIKQASCNILNLK
jgi:aerobic-type carbon monoxide dehydrogenase small subunit (CoxS/CutS family)